MKNGFKIIDFRVRPPVQAYKTLFDLHIERSTWENRFVSGPENAITPSMYKVGEEAGFDLLGRCSEQTHRSARRCDPIQKEG